MNRDTRLALLPPKPIVLNQSSVKDYMNCQRLFAWRRLQGLDTEGRPSALEIGVAVHVGLALYHSGVPLEDTQCAETHIEGMHAFVAECGPAIGEDDVAIVELDQCRDCGGAQADAEHKLCEACGGSGTVLGVLSSMYASLKKGSGIAGSFADKSVEDAYEIAKRVLLGYIEHWQHAKDVWAPLNQEVEFMVEVGPERHDFNADSLADPRCVQCGGAPSDPVHVGTGVFLRGRADNLSMMNGGLWLIDYKTSARLDPRDLQKYDMDIQLSAYIYGISKQLTEESAKDGGAPVQVEGAVIDLLVKTKVPQYARESFTRTAAELAEFEAEFAEIGSRIRDQFERVRRGENWKTVFPKNTDHCFRFYTCAFRDVCGQDTPTRRALYVRRKPDYVDEAQQTLDAIWAARTAAETEK